jgi:hypothetical protein
MRLTHPGLVLVLLRCGVGEDDGDGGNDAALPQLARLQGK